MKALKITINGPKVQKVGFRRFLMGIALENNLSGYASNKKLGHVETLVMGEEEGLNKYLEACKKGPDQAIVENINVENIDPDSNYEYGFEVLSEVPEN